ncbi:UDP-4-amino-4,6-dideoxy-N-acetyl-beta-L-altrosamine transaminase [Fusobacterium mortiferum]|jgi:UDP-4-amino-4,6-dideoxy-N-acetyl-beta-L-altrosamine transaminase|uniref:UDP-4-amino-4, 6-dideoxy-N-acetyl-beta-L-altrosamine transaminase n=1 Tax=Fusobacterium mortiferum TaxID=850 RepID=UPI001F3CEA34|nr:UDP-4-amino-4,6-dideoxy-N-acetyl-beta-L-altrosamine transaminase [Fusobacterium mortiferum]MCF2700348.1 UDP-4-amino-4,6-dideoxy-N-acetyl-beta-L-altrosamine transaminase [Fusobacterium mortiferum]
MKIISYGRQYIDEADIKAVIETLQSDYMTQGPKIKEFEDKVAKYHGCKYAVAFCNGTAALHGAYYAVGLKEGDEFITSPITFAASGNGALYLGGIPKFVDIDKDTYNMDITKLKENITEKTKVITPVSLAGYPVDLKAIREIINETGKDIKIIHDAAHAIGAKRDRRNIVDYADVTILSFHPVKHVTTGEGGMVLTNDEEYYKRLCLFRTHGITRNSEELIENHGAWYYEMQDLGYNYRITDMQCALGMTQMDKLDNSLYRRNQIAKYYEEELKDIEWLKLPLRYFSKEWLDDKKYKGLKEKPENLNSYHLFPVLLENSEERKRFFDYMRENNIFVQVHYIPLHTMPYYKEKYGFKKGDFPVAEDYYSREVSLPMYPTLNKEELRYIVKIIKEFKK